MLQDEEARERVLGSKFLKATFFWPGRRVEG
jgi:hypothetical protein